MSNDTPLGVTQEHPDIAKARSIAFAYIPRDASVREARGWLCQLPYLTSDEITTICEVHLEDNILQQWRADDVA